MKRMITMTQYTKIPEQDDFNEKDYFMREIAPLMKKVHEMCEEKNIPMVANFVFAREGNTISQNVCCMVNKTRSRIFNEMSLLASIAEDSSDISIIGDGLALVRRTERSEREEIPLDGTLH
jgi:hypothetical protein